ncbi:MAG: nitroreductase family protein [Candidatus Thorarchaeota archaeon]
MVFDILLVNFLNALEVINTRRSVRKFLNKKVPKDLVSKIIAAGMNAPSAGNQQPWQFIIVDERSVLEEIAKVNPYAACAKDASVGILVCGDLQLEKYKGYWPLDCSAATENILLAAHSLGLGTVWTGVYPKQERIDRYKRLLNIPENIVPIAFIPVGYPAEEPNKENRFKKDRIHYNKW